MWWDTTKIDATVTRQYVCAQLLPDEIQRLDQPLGFGDGLTDGTYWEWIDEKAKRIFLILVELGIPDQIFGVVDDSWDDEDLPIPLDQVERLALTARPDEKVDRRFYYRQFHFLIRHVEQGDHLVYEDAELPPVDILDKRPGISASLVDKIQLPNKPGDAFLRRRIPLGTSPGTISPEDLLLEINASKRIQNDHIMSYYASYTHQGFGYVIFSPAWEYSLKSMMVTMPPTLKAVEKASRRQMVMNWIHCLIDSLCYLHGRGRSHGNIKPSSILFRKDHHILYTDVSRVGPEAVSHGSGSNFDKEAYDYAAPEQWYRPANGHQANSHRKMGSSPVNTAFMISRGSPESNSTSPMHRPTPQLDGQAADIFSLGCIFLEILGFLLKRQSKAFAAHRAAKHKTPGRGGAVLDSSFHKNIGQVESWMSGLAKDATKKDDKAFRGVSPMLQVVARMLSTVPQERPTAHEVEKCMYKILTEECEISEPHCVHQYGNWDFGMNGLRIGKESGPLAIPGAKRSSTGPPRAIGHSRGSSSGYERPPTSGSAGSSPPKSGSLSPRFSKWRTWQTPGYSNNMMTTSTGAY